MKKSISIIILLLILLPTVYANEYFYKPEVSKGETLLVTIDGNFVDSLLEDNIKFYRGQVLVPLEFDVSKIDDLYYIYALISDQAQSGNYSLRINDVGYYKGSQIIDDEIRLNFTVLDSISDFSINKGFLSTNQDFSFKVQNLQESRVQIQISEEIIYGDASPLKFSFDDIFNNSQVLILKSGEEREIIFDTSSISQTSFRNIIFSSAFTSYSIPVFIFANKSYSNNTDIQSINFKSNPSDIDFTTSTNNKKTDYIYIINTGNSKLDNINIKVSDSIIPYVNLSTYKILKLDSGSEIKVEMYSKSDKEVLIDGEISISTINETIKLPVKISFVKGYIPPVINQTNSTNNSSNNNNQNNNNNTDTPATKFSMVKAIGWFLLVAVVLFLLWFYLKKYKRTKKKVDILDIGERGGLKRETHNKLDLKRRPSL